jgi:hypothetical protein
VHEEDALGRALLPAVGVGVLVGRERHILEVRHVRAQHLHATRNSDLRREDTGEDGMLPSLSAMQ